MNKGKIIFLNGVSSSGKTTLAKLLQKNLDKPYYWIANDTFCDMIPSKFWDEDYQKASFHAFHLMNNTIKMFSDKGENVIVDHVILNEGNYDLLKDCVEVLHNNPVFFIHVICPIEELRSREKKRGDRDIGQAESQLPLLNPQEAYDLTVDTTEECASKIIPLISDNENYKAFKILYSQFNNTIE